MFRGNEARLPHSLRIPIFALRVAVGLSLFYAGYSELFDRSLLPELKERSLGGLYGWLTASTAYPWLHPLAPWLFLVIGVCLLLGFATRFAAALGIALLVLSYLPNILSARLSILQFLSNEIIVTICLFVILFSRAGNYIGIDKFMHFSLRGRR